jgi:hypothetical protein
MAQICRNRNISRNKSPNVLELVSIKCPTVTPADVTGRRVSKRI